MSSTLTAEQKEKLQYFLDVTESKDRASSIEKLSSSNWNVEELIEKYLADRSNSSGNSTEDEMEEDNDEDCEDDCDFQYESDDCIEIDFNEVQPPVSPSSIVLFPEEYEGISEALSAFSKNFKKRYCSSSTAPEFYTEDLESAMKLGFQQLSRPILFYIHNDKSVASNIFPTQVLCNDAVMPIIKNNFILFPWDVTEKENLDRLIAELLSCGLGDLCQFLRIFTQSQVESFPLMFPLLHNKATQDIPTFCQSSDTTDVVIGKLYGAVEEFKIVNKSQNEMRREREERAMIRQMQEQEYQASLAADLARIEKKRQEDEEKKQEEERKAKEIEEAERIKAEEALQMEKVAQSIPAEPAVTEQNILHIKFRLPEGKQMMRRFRKEETINTLVMFLFSQGYSSEKFKFFNSDFPKKNVMEKFELENTFGTAKWPAREQIFVEEI